MKKKNQTQHDLPQAGYKHENPEHPNEFGSGIPPEKRGDDPGDSDTETPPTIVPPPDKYLESETARKEEQGQVKPIKRFKTKTPWQD